jgi:hypothetical protein
MRGSVAKQIRRRIYGPDGTHRARSYTYGLTDQMQRTQTITADDRRGQYRGLKATWRTAPARQRAAMRTALSA